MASFYQIVTQWTSAQGWRRRALAFVLGVLATLSLPPYFLFPLLFVSFSGLFLLLRSAPSVRAGFADGWWWGWGFYISGMYWMCNALLTDAEKFAWLIPFALFGLTSIIAVYPAIACAMLRKVNARGLPSLIIFAGIWLALEHARGYLFSGFPWNLPAYAVAFSEVSLQSAALLGAYGLSGLVVLLAVLPAAFWCEEISPLRAKLVALAGVLVVIGLGLWGYQRLQAADARPEAERFVPNLMLRLVQADIAQHHKWQPEKQMQGLQAHIDLTRSAGLEKITHVIWPETALPYVVRQNSAITRLIGQVLPDDISLISGALRDQGTGDSWRVWNSMVMFNGKGDVTGVYDKSKLVPFGEFLPFRELIPEGWKTPVGNTDYSAGEGMQTLHWQGLPPVSPLICYEVIFPERAVNDKDPAKWLLSVTNDAWFGDSSAPHQHFQMARMRAVEQGVPLIRVANTGISASVDAYGRVQALLGVGEKGILDVALPASLPDRTPYGEHKDVFMQLLIALALLLTLCFLKPIN